MLCISSGETIPDDLKNCLKPLISHLVDWNLVFVYNFWVALTGRADNEATRNVVMRSIRQHNFTSETSFG